MQRWIKVKDIKLHEIYPSHHFGIFPISLEKDFDKGFFKIKIVNLRFEK